jgi:hypothetical protein
MEIEKAVDIKDEENIIEKQSNLEVDEKSLSKKI